MTHNATLSQAASELSNRAAIIGCALGIDFSHPDSSYYFNKIFTKLVTLRDAIPDPIKAEFINKINENLESPFLNCQDCITLLKLLEKFCERDYRRLNFPKLNQRIQQFLPSANLEDKARLIGGLAKCGFNFDRCGRFLNIGLENSIDEFTKTKNRRFVNKKR